MRHCGFAWVFLAGISFALAAARQTPDTISQTIKLPSSPTSGALSSNGDRAAIVGADKKLRVWNIADGSLVQTIDLSTADIDYTAVSPGGQWIVTGDPVGNVVVWNAETGKSQIQLQIAHAPSAAAFSSDGRILAIAPASEPIQIFDIASGRKICQTGVVTGGTAAIAFARNGAFIAAADTDTAVRISDARTCKLMAENRDFLLEPLAIDFTADGTQVIAAGADKVIAFIDATNGKLVRKLPKIDQPISWSSLRVSPDGKHFATVSMTAENLSKPRPVTVWDLASGEKKSEWMPPTIARSIGWTHDGHLISAGDDADSLFIWRIQ
jgi:WD40 repeat protein